MYMLLYIDTFPVSQEVERLNIEVMTSKQMQERLLASLDEREEMEIRIEDLGQTLYTITATNDHVTSTWQPSYM